MKCSPFCSSGLLSKLQRTRFRRALRAESLESRCLLAADLEACDDLPREPADLLEADRAHYAQIANSFPGGGGQGGVAPLVPLADTFLLHSRPASTKVIYLDFDGFTAAGTPWNSSRGRDPIVSPVWDPDGDGAAFSNAELMRIQGVWQRVSADFAAFDVNVTTEYPGEAALVQDGNGDTHWGVRVVFTPDDFPAPGAGGVAYVNSFSWGYNTPGATDTPVYVFNMAEMPAAAAASHEVGHSLGLSHDGTTNQHPTQPSAEYYNGHGSGENGWIPIMGSGYYQNVSTWDNGSYFATSNGAASANYGRGPDDLQIISTFNGFGYVPDSEANSLNSAQAFSSTIDYATGVASISQFGVISQTTDADFFSFQTGSGTVNLDFDPYVTEAWVKAPDGSLTRSIETAYFNANNWSQNQGTNLDIEATLYDSLGNEVAKSNPNGLRASFRNLQLNSGVYYVKIDGVSFADPTQNPPIGYTDYASLGQYLVTGTVPVALGLVLPPSPVVYVEDTPAVQVAATATVVDAIPGGYASSSLVVSVVAVPGATDRLQLDPTLAGLVVQPDGSIEDGGVVIASIAAATTDTRLSLQLTAGTSAASIVKLVQSVTFEARGDAPDQSGRSVSFQLTKSGLNTSDAIPITVVAVNDAPSVQDAALVSVPEDTLAPDGQALAAVLGPSFSDPDANSSMAGAAIVNNGTPVTQGLWQIAFSKFGPWLDVPAVSSTNRLALSSATLIRFVPAADFNGDVDPIQVQVIDNSYGGAFSSTET